MTKVVGVRFRNAGKVYFFDPGDFEVRRSLPVIVETARGLEYGTCVNDVSEVEDDEIVAPLKPIIRIATEKDIETAVANRFKEKEAFKTCQSKIREHELEMKLIDAEYTFDNSKILFYFTADGRVDFRDLVKDLAGVFRTRIELRQVGVRDETKILGGIGICGRPLCCHSYLADFVPVSIKMAKEQNLSLNPTKISGVCGRLMCCLKNEEEVYEEQNRKLPGVGDYVTTIAGERGVVQNVNIFHETVKVLVQNGEDKELKEYKAEDIRFKKHRKRGKLDLTPEEMEQLKSLEPEEIADLGVDLDSEAEVSKSADAKGERRSNRPDKREKNSNRDQNKDQERNQSNEQSRNQNHEQSGEQGRNQNREQNRGRRDRGFGNKKAPQVAPQTVESEQVQPQPVVKEASAEENAAGNNNHHNKHNNGGSNKGQYRHRNRYRGNGRDNRQGAGNDNKGSNNESGGTN